MELVDDEIAKKLARKEYHKRWRDANSEKRLERSREQYKEQHPGCRQNNKKVATVFVKCQYHIPCERKIKEGESFCWQHKKIEEQKMHKIPNTEKTQLNKCQYSKFPCSRTVKDDATLCWQHQKSTI
jgi:hypothetical protein